MKKLLSVFIITSLFASTVFADKVCLRIRSGNKISKRVVTTGNCPRGFTEIINTSTLTGPAGAVGATGATGAAGAAGEAGPIGATGADGSFKVWGDGSDGDFTLTADGYLDTRKQYRNITIPAGITAYVPAGSTIRCTGTITIAGGFYPDFGANGGFISSGFDSNSYIPALQLAEKGISISGAQSSECGNAAIQSGGNGGIGLSAEAAKSVTRVGKEIFGGGGGPVIGGSGGQSGAGSAIYCKEGITISASGEILVNGGDGNNGNGGGAGGIVVLATNNALNVLGTINARGGNGGSSTASACPGGGGTGGIVHFIGKTIVNTGTVNVAAGATGSSPVAPSNSIRCGGGGGGATFGLGGAGKDFSFTGGNCNFGSLPSNGTTITTTISTGLVEPLLLF